MNVSQWPIGFATAFVSGTLVLIGGQIGLILASLAVLASAAAFTRRRDPRGFAALLVGWGLSWCVILGRVILSVATDPSRQTTSITYATFGVGVLSVAAGIALWMGSRSRASAG
jgi:uncharacterized membrane protein